MSVFTFLSWNLAMMERSDFAPAGWRIDQTEAVIRRLVLGCDPDFVLFQELPGLVPYIDTHDMVRANAKGQSGDIATLVRRDLAAGIEAEQVKNGVIARIKSADLEVVNVHLPSGSGGDLDRLDRLRQITAQRQTGHLAVIGDSNTRTKEEEVIGALGLIGDRPPEPTWNSRVARFRRDARGYTSYFTRVFHSEGVSLSDQKVWAEPMKEGTAEFHVSDHFALSGRVEVGDNGDTLPARLKTVT